MDCLFRFQRNRSAIVYNFDIYKVVNKLLQIVKIFIRSPLKIDILQRHVKEIYPNWFNVIHASKTRPSSLANMLEEKFE